jgi:geranyl-CoA carboxylase beta subunit
MPPIESRLDLRGAEFVANRTAMLELADHCRALEQRVRDNSAARAERFHKRQQLLPRERLARLLDRNAPFLELSTLAGYQMHDDDGAESIAGGGFISGIGFVAGRRVVIGANDSAIKGGTISPMGLKKSLRAQEIAAANKLPCINLIESGGANLLYQAELFVDGGRAFANLARLSAAGIPQITVVHGSSTAGGAYLPGLSDYIIVVRGRSRIFLAGPPLVKAALGEEASEEALGGAEMHMSVSGTAEYMAEDDAGALDLARELVAKLPWDEALPAPAARPWQPPRYDADELLAIVSPDYRKPYDVHEVIARLVDDSDFLEFKPDFGPGTVCGHARIEGHACGLIGNNGPIYPAGAAKATHFIQACCQAGAPLVYLQNITGYMVGVEAEQQGIVKHGAKMIQAVANATVPQLTVVIGASFGAGYYGMCGRPYDPRFIFAWPNSRIGVMGSEQAARVMEIVTASKLERLGATVDEAVQRSMSQALRDKLEAESTALYATARLWDDGIIDPRDTRRVLAFTLAVCRDAERRTLRPTTFGVARP